MITVDQINDLVTISQRELGKLRWTNIATDLQEYTAMQRLLRKKKIRFDSGTHVQWNVMVDYVESAKNVSLWGVDSVNVGDAMKTAYIPWRHCTTNYAIDRREVKMNSGAAKIVDLVETRRAQAMIALAELMEKNFWGKPADSGDELTPYGVQYWIVPNSTKGFNGGNPDGFSDGPGGLDASTYENWRNYTATYEQITSADLFAEWREAATKTHFKSPVKHRDYETGAKYEYFTNYTVLGEIERILELRNDNLGNDIAAYDGRAVFRRTPIIWVPYFDSDDWDGELNPVYGINWGVFNPVFLRGEYMAEETGKAPNQHTVSVTHIDCTINFRCTNRRRTFVLYNVPA